MAYMAANRLNVFGSLGGKEIREAGLGNLGLQDRGYPMPCLASWDSSAITLERAAIRWVNRFIHAFGGDPSKVTM